MQHPPVRRAERACRHHHRDRGAAAARDVAPALGLRVLLEQLEQRVGIERVDARLHPGVERRGRLRVEVVRQVGAGDQQRAAAGRRGDAARPRAPRSSRASGSRSSTGTIGTSRQQAPKERQLHLERMFARVRGGQSLDDRRCVSRSAAPFGSTGAGPSGESNAPSGQTDDAVERDEVRRADEQRHVVLSPAPAAL